MNKQEQIERLAQALRWAVADANLALQQERDPEEVEADLVAIVGNSEAALKACGLSA